MLRIYKDINELDFRQLMDVYEETNDLTGKANYPGEPKNLQILFAEQDFYQYLKIFFEDGDALYALWTEERAYKAALRLERYRDGWLITALEVAPAARKQGCATKLLDEVKGYAAENNLLPLYSHVEKRNMASISTHKKCEFSVIAENAVFLDGSTHNNYYTYFWSDK